MSAHSSTTAIGTGSSTLQTTSSARTSGRASGGFRGGRGGGAEKARGRGGFGSVARGGRGDYRGGIRGGRGDRSRGGRGFHPRRTVRHRSLAGKRGADASSPGEPAAKREKKDQKPNSNFALLYSLLGDATTIAEYIRKYHASDKFREAKSLHSFLQAVSQRDTEVYEQLMSKFKDEVFTTLERLFALYALGNHSMTPSAHEFLIRCEQQGVRKASWAEGVRTLPPPTPDKEEEKEEVEGEASEAAPQPLPSTVLAPALDATETSLLSPRELLKKMAVLDPVGRLQRLIELCSTVDDLGVCAKRLSDLVMQSEQDDEGCAGSSGRPGKLDFATKCQLISKLLSKGRRIVEPTFAPEQEPQDILTATSEAEDLRDEVLQDEAVPVTLGGTSSEVVKSATITHRREALSSEEVAVFQSVLSTALHSLEAVLESRPSNVVQQPLAKFSKILEWCQEKNLLAAADEHFITLLETKSQHDIEEQATQLETVIHLKSLPTGDSASLKAMVDRLWKAGEGKCLSPSSVDVLSAIAVAASPATVDGAVKRLVAERLAQTQQHLAGTVVLPRRALRFVNEEQNRLKQAAIAKQLHEEGHQNVKKSRLTGLPEADGLEEV